MKVLVLNAGSSSVKHVVIDPQTEACELEGKIERIGQGVTHEQAFSQILERCAGISIDAVGHRVVHGGSDFHQAVVVNDKVEAAIAACVPLAPLHNPHNLAGIRAARAALGTLPHVAVFDTAFHVRLPRRARTYAIDQEVAEREGIRRYGFHGTSHEYVAGVAAKAIGRSLAELRMITLHLGNGASACAVELGHSTETSMGMTPLEGLVMGTRAGDIDPGVLLALARKGMTADDLDTLLNQQSGLAGLSGHGNDLRDIERRAAEGDDRSRLAIQVFAHRVRKYIGAYAAVMGGLDAVVLTGGIGENGAAMRLRILQRFDYLGLLVDEERNGDARVDAKNPVARISSDVSRVVVLAVRTNEELAIARQTAHAVRDGQPRVDSTPIPHAGRESTPRAGPTSIPIAVSARHFHLCAASFEKLFGPGRQPTRWRDISQPGQYACEEKVNLIGPRGRIDGVRLLGPLRGKDQVEISRTDEFKLGVDAPVRDSGKVEGSAPIILEGPAGTLHLREGLICAKRHIHMAPADAKQFGVKDGDEVEVRITGGPRDLTFGDVLIRVSPMFKLEMHIDTDEANAAEIDQGASGGLVYTDVTGATGTLVSRRARADQGS
ncbi:MAG TPA: acetate/propionate family kinase [Burkholderiales bacterium]|jgi:acetate kinase|nr:acetate/propionate family kinase [Burkholderiales bacterium]